MNDTSSMLWFVNPSVKDLSAIAIHYILMNDAQEWSSSYLKGCDIIGISNGSTNLKHISFNVYTVYFLAYSINNALYYSFYSTSAFPLT